MTREQLARFQLIDYLKESAPEALGLRAFELKWGAVDVFCNDRGSPRVLYAPVVGDKFTLYYSEGLPVEGPVQSACPCPRRLPLQSTHHAGQVQPGSYPRGKPTSRRCSPPF